MLVKCSTRPWPGTPDTSGGAPRARPPGQRDLRTSRTCVRVGTGTSPRTHPSSDSYLRGGILPEISTGTSTDPVQGHPSWSGSKHRPPRDRADRNTHRDRTETDTSLVRFLSPVVGTEGRRDGRGKETSSSVSVGPTQKRSVSTAGSFVGGTRPPSNLSKP